MERGQQHVDQVRIPVGADPDVVVVRQSVRDAAQRVGFARTDLIVIASAVSKVARSIVRSAGARERSSSDCWRIHDPVSGWLPATPARGLPTSTVPS